MVIWPLQSRAFGQELHCRKRGERLAGAALADHAANFPWCNVERDSLQDGRIVDRQGPGHGYREGPRLSVPDPRIEEVAQGPRRPQD